MSFGQLASALASFRSGPRRSLRTRRLRVAPRDALSVLEIARLQSLIGQIHSAERYVERAVKLAPNDRYVLRSAARFWAHRSKSDTEYATRALEVIWASDAVRFDPWVQAAEVSVANICGRTPRWGVRAEPAAEAERVTEAKTAELQAAEDRRLAALVAKLQAYEFKPIELEPVDYKKLHELKKCPDKSKRDLAQRWTERFEALPDNVQLAWQASLKRSPSGRRLRSRQPMTTRTKTRSQSRPSRKPCI